MATRLPCTNPPGRFIRFTHGAPGYCLSFLQGEEMLPGLEDVILPDAKAQMLLEGSEVVVTANLVMNMYFKPTLDSVTVHMEAMQIADIPLSIFKLGLELAVRSKAKDPAPAAGS